MLRIGVAQIHNDFDLDANLASILRAIEVQARHGADLVLFPECATTGFNTGMLNLREGPIVSAVAAVRRHARLHRQTVALPTPWPRGDGRFLNSVLLVDEEGEISRVFHKIGFQRGEDRLFVPGEPHPRWFEVKGRRIGLVVCIEASHGAWDYLKEDDAPEAILWPGFYAYPAGSGWGDFATDESRKVRSNIQQWAAPLLQATCASSPESESWPGKIFGGSPVISADGAEVFTARRGAEDMLLIEVEDRRIRAVRSLLH